MKNIIRNAAAIAVGLTLCVANASPLPPSTAAQVKARIAPLLEGLTIEKISPTRHGSLYEVLTPVGLFYTDKAGSFVIFGAAIVDSKTKVNLTEQRLNELSKFVFTDLPLKDAIKTVKGDGSRVIATFEDPNCSFCKKLMQELEKINNVTVYTFLIPVMGPDSAIKSRAIWCAKDPGKAWTGFMNGTAALPASPTGQCDTPFDRNQAIARKLRIAGTPALLFVDNTKTPGYVNAAAIEAKLKK